MTTSDEIGTEAGSRGLGDTKYSAAVACLPLMTPQRLAVMLHGRCSEEVWSEVVHRRPRVPRGLSSMRSLADARPGTERGGAQTKFGTPEEVATKWAVAAREFDVDRYWLSLHERGIAVLRHGDVGYPERLISDPQPPEVLFARGRTASKGAAVAIVGTRRATHYGTEVAAELGAGLSRAGVSVISGLAAGIDAAAHEGALAALGTDAARPVGVVGGGVDVYYPTRNRRLTDRVAAAGAVISEAPPGASPEPWRFPLRNRIIAALAQVVVIVESTRSGGAMHTVEAALTRGRDVFAVPGSVRSLASEGTNELLSAGAQVARDTDDVLVAVEQQCTAEGVAPPRPGPSTTKGCDPARQEASTSSLVRQAVLDRLHGCSDAERDVYASLDEHPRSIDVICQRCGLGLGATALALDQLMSIGLASPTDGAWRKL